MITVTIKINGVEYNLKGKENEEYLLDVAGFVDGKVREIMGNNPRLSSTAIATLAALNIADELFKCDREIDDLLKKRNSLEERHLTLRERLKEMKTEMEENAKAKDTEIAELNSTVAELRKTIETMELRYDEAQALAYKVEELEKGTNGITELQEEINKLNFVNNTLEKELKEKEDEALVSRKELHNLKLKLNNIETKESDEYKNLVRENKLLKSSNDDLRTAVEDSYIKLSTFEQENGQLSIKEEELRDRIVQLEKELKEKAVMDEDKFSDKISNLEESYITEINQLKEMLLEKEIVLSEKEDELLRLEEELEDNNSINLSELHYDKEEEYKSQIDRLKKEMAIMEEEVKKASSQTNKVRERAKATHLQLQNSRYKVLDLEKKLIDINIELAKERKLKNPLLTK